MKKSAFAGKCFAFSAQRVYNALTTSFSPAHFILIVLFFCTCAEVVAQDRNRADTTDVILYSKDTSMEEVVVIGYGAVKKSDLTGSVSSIPERAFNKGVVNNIDQLIQGKAAGVNIMQTNAQPGGITNIQIRGITSINASNQPLYVIDGMPIDNVHLTNNNPLTNNNTLNGTFSPAPINPLASINPSDISSIEVLKDASATAIFGSRGANGVILITTKKGQKDRTTVSYNGSVGIQTITKEYPVLDPVAYATGFNEYYDYYSSINPSDPILSQVNKYSDEQIANFRNGAGTDWFDILTRNGVYTNHQVSVSGGTDKSTYYASLNFLDHKGVIELSDLRRISGRLNLTQKIRENVEFGINLTASNTKSDIVPVGTGIAGNSRGGALNGPIHWASTIPAYTDNGEINLHPFNATNSNPAALKLVSSNSEQNRVLTTTYLSVNFLKNFSAKATVGYDKALSNNKSFVPAEAKNSLAMQGEATQGSFQNSSMLYNFLLNYKNAFGKSKIDITGGIDHQRFDYSTFVGRSLGFPASSLSYNNMGAGQTQYNGSTRTSNTIMSYLGRINYNYDDRFLITFSSRYDGSSKFAEGEKWGFFPSGAIAWNLGNEKFLSNNGLFDELKLRASYGRVGNQNILNNSSQPLLGSTRPGVIGDQIIFPIGPVSPGNSALTWETTTQKNIGTDFSILGDRLRFTVDVYEIVTTNLLLNFSIPSTSGFPTVVRNSGATQNRGIEFSFSSENIRSQDFSWRTDFNISYNKNQWKDRAGLPFGAEEEFGPLNGIYGYLVDGLWQEGDDIAGSSQPNAHPGQMRFRDVKGRNDDKRVVNGPDGQLNADDRVLLGQRDPRVTMGFTNTLEYKQFRLSFFFNGMFDYKIHNNARAAFENPYRFLAGNGIGTSALNYWRPNNTNTLIANGRPNVYGGSDNSLYIESGNFVRLKNVNLQYTLPFKASWYQNAAVYLNADNVFLITNYSGLDPESASPAYNSSGAESDVYPPARTFTVGVNINF